MKVLRQRLGGAVQFEGVGGRAMAIEGTDVAVSDRGIVDHRVCRGDPAIAGHHAAHP
jgi:hypothetical protein